MQAFHSSWNRPTSPKQPLPGEPPLQYAQRLARDKARAIFASHPDNVVLGADTVVVVDEHLLEKPRDTEDAARMLRLLSGRAHQVITGVCLVAPGYEQTEAEITEVRFSTLSEREIASYVAVRRADGQSRRLRHPGHGVTLGRAHRRLLFQCGWIARAKVVSHVADASGEDGNSACISDKRVKMLRSSPCGELRQKLGTATSFRLSEWLS